MRSAGQPGTDRALHRRPPALLAVLAGGMLGASARYEVARAFPTPAGGWPWATFSVNLVGALVLGVLLEGLARRGADVGQRQVLRLLLGTGMCGALTTFSTLAVEVDLFVRGGQVLMAAVYGAVSLLCGILAAAVGLLLANAIRPEGQVRELPTDPDLLVDPDARASEGRDR